jgi:hypothetical protein
MRRNRGVSLLASTLVAGLVIAFVAVAVSQTDGGGSVAHAAASAADQRDKPDKGDDAGGGPPPWAHADGQGKAHGADEVWKEAWHKLTPAQKQAKMAVLTQAHEQGMAKWADCVAAGGSDASKRAACVKPLPPGLAKKIP